MRELDVRWFRAGVAGCVVAVAAFLFGRLTVWPPHEDETLALFVGRRSLGDLLDTVLGERGGAPLHFVLASGAAHAGGGLTALRLLSAAFALASIPLVAAIAARLAGRTVGLVATVLASASWILLFHGIYGRMYSLFLFTSALSYVALLRALEHGGARRFGLWGLAVLACVAAHPYGALVLASQALYVLLARVRVREALVAIGVVGVLGTPFWLSDLRLANRFDVGVGGEGGKLGSPLRVLEYLGQVAGDFTAGWRLLLAPILIAAGVGFWILARRRRPAALLIVAVVATPTLAFLLARLGGSASPESRHLIFVLPFFVTLVATALVAAGRRFGPAIVAVSLAALVVAQVAWGWSKTPQLFTGEPQARIDARNQAADWLARTSRPDDIFFGYEPVYLRAWERDRAIARTVIPRADSRLAASRLAGLEEPLGRGVWVFDAYDTNNCPCARSLTIERRTPQPEGEYEARVFGPYLVIRTSAPTGTPEQYLDRASQVMIVGKSLFIGDADVNFVTVRRAADRLGYWASSPSRSTSSR
jgi:4-amino-4-deoxy-L-arabinose transferase-like glycosyltransferase